LLAQSIRALDGNRALTFTNQPSLTTGNQPGTRSVGLINNSATWVSERYLFVATIWFQAILMMNLSGANVNIGPRYGF